MVSQSGSATPGENLRCPKRAGLGCLDPPGGGTVSEASQVRRSEPRGGPSEAQYYPGDRPCIPSFSCEVTVGIRPARRPRAKARIPTIAGQSAVSNRDFDGNGARDLGQDGQGRARREQARAGREQARAGLLARARAGEIYAIRRERVRDQARALREQGKSTRAGCAMRARAGRIYASRDNLREQDASKRDQEAFPEIL